MTGPRVYPSQRTILVRKNLRVPPRKRCSICGQVKSYKEFYISAGWSNRGCGLHAACKKCMKTRSNEKHRINPWNYHSYKFWYRLVCDRSNRRHYLVDTAFMTRSRIKRLLKQNRSCECCGRKITFYRRIRYNSVTIDRVIPALGYVKGNIGILCYRCNRLKNDATPKELYRLYRYIKRKRRQFLKDSGCSIGTKQKPAGDKHRRRR
jgi:ribosomal protein S14